MKIAFAIVAAAAAFALPAAAEQGMEHDHSAMAEHDHSEMAEHDHDHHGEVAEAAAPAVENANIQARVKGMVCDFCARAVEKVFGREAAVDSVSVDLDEGAINIALKPGETLSDERITELVKKSGYALVTIDRVGA